MPDETPNIDDAIPDSMQRYSRQVRFPHIGIEGQTKLSQSAALIIGCGALGSAIASTLCRAGVGTLRIVDRDFLELSNLQRQSLYNEADVASGLPKSIVAAKRLNEINRDVGIEPLVQDVVPGNIAALVGGMDVVLDGTDNFETRFLINDACVKFSIPWIYGGCLGADGQTMTIVPGETACLHCLMADGPPPAGTSPTCDAFGVLSPIIQVIASIQSMEALKILSGNGEAVSRNLTVAGLWTNQIRQIDVSKLRERSNCPTCHQQQFEWLHGGRSARSAVLCGRDAVQLSFADDQQLDLPALASRLQPLGRVDSNDFLVRFRVDEFAITAFSDGRAIVSGTQDIATAKRLYAQYIGV